MQTQSGECFVARYDEDAKKWVGFSGKPINDANAQHYLEWAASNMCSSRVDSVVVESHSGGVILRVNGNQSQLIPIDMGIFRAAESGTLEPKPERRKRTIDTTTTKYREVSDWITANYRLVLWKAYRACYARAYGKMTREAAQDMCIWLLEHAEDYDASRGPIEAFCRSMISLRLLVIARGYAVARHRAKESQLEGEVSREVAVTGELEATLPPDIEARDRWVLTQYASGWTLQELGDAFKPPISKPAVWARLQKAIGGVKEYYDEIEQRREAKQS